jgi:hypothetical protein
MALEWIKTILGKSIGSVPARTAFTSERQVRAMLRSIKDGEGILRVHAEHAMPEIAAAGKMFDGLKAHPLLKPFMRHEPQLILVDPNMVLPVLGQIKGAQIFGRKIFMDAHTFDGLEEAERKALLTHEIGHHVRLDVHSRRSFWWPMRKATPFPEARTDTLTVAITGDAAAYESALRKIKEIHPEMKAADQLMHESGFVKNTKARAANGFYLPPEERYERIRRIGKKLEDPETRSHVEAEIKRRLEKVHRQIFSHHAPNGRS